MTDLLILHVTKEKKYTKSILYNCTELFFSSFCDIWQPLSNWNGYNSKSIELRKISKVIASCYRRPLQNEKEKKKIGTKLWRLGPRARARSVTDEHFFWIWINTSNAITFSELITSCYRHRLQNGTGCACLKKKLWPRGSSYGRGIFV